MNARVRSAARAKSRLARESSPAKHRSQVFLRLRRKVGEETTAEKSECDFPARSYLPLISGRRPETLVHRAMQKTKWMYNQCRFLKT